MVLEVSDLFDTVKWFVGVILIPFSVWVWRTNEKSHEKLEKEQAEIRKATDKLKESTSVSYSTLNDRIMDHVDGRVRETIAFVKSEDAKLMGELAMQRGHIGKIFDKMEAHAQRSEDRHIETMSAIHTLATTMHQALATKADK